MKINFSKILEINNLTVTYSSNQSPVLKNLELEVNKGDHLALIGPCLLYTSPSPRDY